MQQQQQDPIPSILYRVEALERSVTHFNQQLDSYVRERENDLKLKILQDTATHIGNEVTALKSDVQTLKGEVSTLKTDIQQRDATQRERQDKIQIRVLWAVVSFFFGIISLTIVAYFTHLIH